MILEFHDHLGSPQRVKATRLVVYLDNGTPVAMTIQVTPSFVQNFRAGDPEFDEQLILQGVTKTVFVTNVPAPPRRSTVLPQ